jgi:type IV pilus assembly protein PilQ
MDKFRADEEAEAKRLQQQKEDEKKKLTEEKIQANEEVPLISEFLPVDFAKADDIVKHIVLSESGKKRGANISIDTRTNTILIKDIPESIEEAKKVVKQFDTPVKQIMIEARIVDATDSFTRDLGIKWNANVADTPQTMSLPSTGGPTVEITGTGAAHINDNGDGGGNAIGGNFSTNAPDGWEGNIGVNFARLTSSGLGILSLDATLAR